MIRWWVVLLVAVACGHGGGSVRGAAPPEDVGETLRRMDECVRRQPHNLECAVRRAEVLEALGRHQEALRQWADVVALSPGHAMAWERVRALAETLSAYSWGVSLAQRVPPPWSPDVTEGWRASVARADSLLGLAGEATRVKNLEEACRILRTALQVDASHDPARLSLMQVLVARAVRGSTWSQRTAPLREALDVGAHPLGGPSGEMATLEDEARTMLANEVQALEAAKGFVPWAGAPFFVVVDTTSYHPSLVFRCEERAWADLTLEFPAQSPCYVLVGKRVSLVRDPRPDSPPVGTFAGGLTAVVLDQHGPYSLVRVGDAVGWVSRDCVVPKYELAAELGPRQSFEVRVTPGIVQVRMRARGRPVFRGEVNLKPYLVYVWRL